jgi:hypothetical protein
MENQASTGTARIPRHTHMDGQTAIQLLGGLGGSQITVERIERRIPCLRVHCADSRPTVDVIVEIVLDNNYDS